MKRRLLTILFVLFCFVGFSQPIVNRATSAFTVLDQNLFSGTSFRLPVYTDTTAANSATSLDSCGKLIFTYTGNKLWYRQCSPKKWLEIVQNVAPTPGDTTGYYWPLGYKYFPVIDALYPPKIGTASEDNFTIGTNNTDRLIFSSAGITNSTTSTDSVLVRKVDGTVAITSKTALGGSVVVNDSIAKGFAQANSSITGAALKPSDIAWTKIHTSRYFKLIDENFIHYQSNFYSNDSSDFTVTGTTPTWSNGQAGIVGNTVWATKVSPKSAWWSMELDMASYTTPTGTYSRVGPALYRNSTNFIAGVYDVKMDSFFVIVNGTITQRLVNPGLSKENLTLYLTGSGNDVTFWAKSNEQIKWLFTTASTVDLMANGVLDNYKYAVYSAADAAFTHYLSSFRAGAVGGVGLFNLRLVTNEDGSTYQYGNKILFTADVSNNGTITTRNYARANATLFSMDMDNFHIESLGRFYFRRGDPSLSTTRIYGGQDISLSWWPSQKKWLMDYVWSDIDSAGVKHNDSYIWLDYEAAFGENIIDYAQFNSFGIDTTTYPNLIYDARIYKEGDSVFVVASYTNTNRSTGSWSLVNPIKFSGLSLSSLSVVKQYSSSNFFEGPSIARLRGATFVNYYTYGDPMGITLRLNPFDSVGTLQFSTSSSKIASMMWVPIQKNDSTTYYQIGFDNVGLPITNLLWTDGNVQVYKGGTKSRGYEFPIRIANQVQFPTIITKPFKPPLTRNLTDSSVLISWKGGITENNAGLSYNPIVGGPFNIRRDGTDYVFPGGVGSHMRFLNASPVGISALWAGKTDGTDWAKIRFDYTKSITYVGFGTGTHDFYIGGDFGVGTRTFTVKSGTYNTPTLSTIPLDTTNYKLDVIGATGDHAKMNWPTGGGAETVTPVFGGRLTLATGNAVPTADIIQDTLWYTQHTSRVVTLWTGGALTYRSFTSDLALSLAGKTSANTNYDIWVRDSSGFAVLDLTAWSGDNTRATNIAYSGGIKVKSGDSLRAYLGTIRAGSAGTTEDSQGGTASQVGGKRFVWNNYNQVRRTINVFDGTNSWDYTTATIRQVNGNAGNQVAYVVGDSATLVTADYITSVYQVGAASRATVGIGVSSTTAYSGFRGSAFLSTSAATISANYSGSPGLGYFYLAALEKGSGGSNCIFSGDEGGDGTQMGLRATITN